MKYLIYCVSLYTILSISELSSAINHCSNRFGDVGSWVLATRFKLVSVVSDTRECNMDYAVYGKLHQLITFNI